jgi:hypothetical protein
MEGEAWPCFPHTSPSHEESGLKHGLDRNSSARRTSSRILWGSFDRCYSMISKTVRFLTLEETALRMVLMA